MNLIEHGLRVGLLLLAHRRERVADTLVLAGRHQAALDAELVHRAGEPEAVHQHADRADDARLVGVDLIGGSGDVVGTRGADFFDDRINLFLVQGLQALDLVVDDAGLHGAAAGRIDAQHDALRARVLERILQRTDDVLGARVGLGGNLSANFDQRGVRAGGNVAVVAGDQDRPQQQRKQRQPHQAKEHTPAPVAAAIAQVVAGEFLHHALPRRRRCGCRSRARGHRGRVGRGWRRTGEVVFGIHGRSFLQPNQSANAGWVSREGYQ